MEQSEKFISQVVIGAVVFLLLVQLVHGIQLTYLKRRLDQHVARDRQDKRGLMRMLRSLRDSFLAIETDKTIKSSLDQTAE